MITNTRLGMKPVVALFAVVALMLAAALSLGTRSASATDVTPVLVSGNPSCVGLSYDFGYKPQPEPPPSGTYTIPGTSHTININSDGTTFSWTSTIGIDAVIVKGGPNANVYVYDPPTESFGDIGLHAPDNASGGSAAISHIEFCYDYELGVSKTAVGTYTRTYTWTIDKTVSPASWDLFVGDTGTSDYDVTVDQTVTDSDFAVSGTITISNPAPFPVSFSVADSYAGAGATISCPGGATVGAGGQVECTYSVGNLGGPVGGTNTATVTSNTSGVSGGTASVDVAFGGPTTKVGYETINVSDTRAGSLGSANGDRTFEYSETFDCANGTDYKAPNTATIVETGETASASVDVDCHKIEVSKTANTSRTKTWTWDIEKTGDVSELRLSLDQVYDVGYTVSVSGSDHYSDLIVSGTISVYNPAPIPATINSVSDVVSTNIPAEVECAGVESFPYPLASKATLTCTYEVEMEDRSNRTNTATAVLQNYAYSSSGVGTPSVTSTESGSAPVNFSTGTLIKVDECIEVSDTFAGATGLPATVCANDLNETGSKIFTYTRTISYSECGEYTVENTASFITDDTETTGSDDHTIDVDVPCDTGCTLTQGYWKTHSANGPAPYDDAWLELGDVDGDGEAEGAGETFFNTSMTYYEVLWTAPAGNPYYNLAQQYIAAKLNIANGASSTTAVNDAIVYAEGLFGTKTPSQVSAFKGAARAAVLANATILDNYNNGLIGPGHCSE